MPKLKQKILFSTKAEIYVECKEADDFLSIFLFYLKFYLNYFNWLW